MDPLIVVVVLVATYFIWTAIHEVTHVLTSHVLIGVSKVLSFKIWPHVHPQHGFRWGSVSYELKAKPTEVQQFIMSMSPRIPEILSIMLIPVVSGYGLIFVLGGLVGLVTAIFSISKGSDTVISEALLFTSQSRHWFLRGIMLCFVAMALFLLLV